MDKPCFQCAAYNKHQDECSILVKLQALHLDKSNGSQERDEKLTNRNSHLDELLLQRPCRFSLQILRWASFFRSKRGLKAHDEPDIHNSVVASLIGLDFRQIRPTYDDFRRYVTAMTRSAVQQEYSRRYGDYCCGTCAFFLEGRKQCGCPALKPVLGRQYIPVTYSTRPGEVVHNSMLLIDKDDILDWVGFCSQLSKEGNGAPPCCSRRIWELLSSEMQGAILHTARTGRIDQTFKLSVVEALNEILGRQDFYQASHFSDVNLTSEVRELLKSRQKGLAGDGLRRLNRLLLEVSYPRVIAESHKGCSYYDAKQVVDVNSLDLLTRLGTNEVEDILKYMESLGPRQLKLAGLLRIMLEGYTNEENGYEVAEIALRTGKHRTTISKELNGTTEKEKNRGGEEIIYHQAGAFDIFLAIYTGAIFTLERTEKRLWSVVNRRDFNSDTVQPGFIKIGSELNMSKREAIERYVDGWEKIKTLATKGGGSMSNFKDDTKGQRPKQPQSARGLAQPNEMPHPDFHLLLTYAEGALDREARKLITGHVLMCAGCSSALEHIETELISEQERPVSIAKRGRWLAARLAGQLRKPSDAGDPVDRTLVPAGLVMRANRLRVWAALTYGLAVFAAATIFVLLLRGTQQRRFNEQLASLTSVAATLRGQNESLQQENIILREQPRKAAVAEGKPPQFTLTQQAELRQRINQLQEKNITLEKLLTQQQYARPHEVVTLTDSELLAMAERHRDGTAETLRGTQSPDKYTPLPLGPILTAVRSPHPTLRWRPVPEAQHYKVVVVDKEGTKIYEENVGTQTQLTLSAAKLRQDQDYFWQVEAFVSDSAQSDKSNLSSPAKFWVIDAKALREVEETERNNKSSAMALINVYAKHGLYEDARTQVKRLTELLDGPARGQK